MLKMNDAMDFIRTLLSPAALRVMLICLTLQLLVFLVLLGLFGGKNWTLYNDSGDYIGIANSILRDGRFAFQMATPDGSRTPAYPLFIAVFGAHVWLVILIQHVLAAFIGFFTWRISELVNFSSRIGLAAAILFSLEPTVVVWTNQALTETLFTFFILVATFLFLQKSSYIGKYVSAACFGLAALTRPVGFFFFSLPVIFLLYDLHKRKIRIRNIFLYIFIWLLVLCPWYLRNYHTFGVLTLDTMSKVVLNDEVTQVLGWHAGERLAEQLDIFFPVRQSDWIESGTYVGRFNRNPTSNRYYKQRALAIMRAYPLTFTAVHFSGISGLLFANNYDYYAGLLAKRKTWFFPFVPLVGYVGMIVWVLIPAFAFFGVSYSIIESKSRVRRDLFFLAGFILYFMAVTGHGGNDRFRYPISSILFLFAMYGIQCLYKVFLNHRITV